MTWKGLYGICSLVIKDIEMKERSVIWSWATTRYLCMGSLQEVLERLFEPLKVCGRISIEMKIGDGSELCCFSVNFSYCCDIPKEKDVSSVKHVFLVRKLYNRCFASLKEMGGLWMAKCPPIKDTKSAREVFRECMEEFIDTKDNNEKRINVNRKEEKELPSSSLLKVNTFLYDSDLRLNRTVP